MAIPISDKLRKDPSLENVKTEFAHLQTRELKELMIRESVISRDLEWDSRESLERRIVRHIIAQEAIGGYGRGR